MANGDFDYICCNKDAGQIRVLEEEHNKGKRVDPGGRRTSLVVYMLWLVDSAIINAFMHVPIQAKKILSENNREKPRKLKAGACSNAIWPSNRILYTRVGSATLKSWVCLIRRRILLPGCWNCLSPGSSFLSCPMCRRAAQGGLYYRTGVRARVSYVYVLLMSEEDEKEKNLNSFSLLGTGACLQRKKG